MNPLFGNPGSAPGMHLTLSLPVSSACNLYNRLDPDQARHFVRPDLAKCRGLIWIQTVWLPVGNYLKFAKTGFSLNSTLARGWNEPVHEISNNMVLCATSKASDQPAHWRSLIRAFSSLWLLSYWLNTFGVSKGAAEARRSLHLSKCHIHTSARDEVRS